MKNKITTLEIKHFKSIRHLNIKCKKINLFIGKPNVGKSNILEAISLLGFEYSQTNQKYLSDLIRYERLENLFYDNENTEPVEVLTNIGAATVKLQAGGSSYVIAAGPGKRVFDYFNQHNHYSGNNYLKYLASPPKNKKLDTGAIEPSFAEVHDSNSQLGGKYSISSEKLNPVKKYEFEKFINYYERFHNFLLPPNGNNLYSVVQHNKHLYKELNSLFKEYDLKLVLNKKENALQIQKEIDGVVYSYPYYTIADTLQRIIFHLMAIECNSNSVLLFEEPESHSFPTYIRNLAEKIIDDVKNQYFINTHSPFILNTIIENANLKDVAVFVTTYEDFETKVKPLSQKEIKNMLDYGSDIFFNLK